MTDYVLEILDGDHEGERVPLGSAPLRVGRRPDNDLVLADEKTSGHHAEIAPEDGGFVLRDLGSRNGTLLDGRAVTEVVLSPHDVFQVGRVRLRFAPAAAESDLQMHRLDTAALLSKRRSRSVLGLAVLLVVVGGGGAWWYLGRGGGGPVGPQGPAAPLVVAGNILGQEAASCEGGGGWQLDGAAGGFRASGSGHTGTGCLRAAGTAEEGTGYAFARLAQPFSVLGETPLEVRAFVRTTGAGLVGVRVRFFGEDDGEPGPFAFTTGTTLAAHEDWEELFLATAVPPRMNRAVVELLAAVPGPDDRVSIDDLSVVRGGKTEAVEQKTRRGYTVTGIPGAYAIQSLFPEDPVIVAGLRPLVHSGPLAALGRAGLLVPSDTGARLEVETTDTGFEFTCAGGILDGLIVNLPPGATATLMGRTGEQPFDDLAGATAGRAEVLLAGSASTRCLLRRQEAGDFRVVRSQDRDSLIFEGARKLVVQVDFHDQQRAAGELVRRARAARDAGRPGEALDLVARQQRELPHSAEELGRGRALRSELLEGLRRRLDGVEAETRRSAFFRTRGGFERALREVETLVAQYGEHNLPDRGKVDALAATARTEIQRIDEELNRRHVDRLRTMVEVFQGEGLSELATMVQEYLDRRHGGGEGGDR